MTRLLTLLLCLSLSLGHVAPVHAVDPGALVKESHETSRRAAEALFYADLSQIMISLGSYSLYYDAADVKKIGDYENQLSKSLEQFRNEFSKVSDLDRTNPNLKAIDKLLESLRVANAQIQKDKTKQLQTINTAADQRQSFQMATQNGLKRIKHMCDVGTSISIFENAVNYFPYSASFDPSYTFEVTISVGTEGTSGTVKHDSLNGKKEDEYVGAALSVGSALMNTGNPYAMAAGAVIMVVASSISVANYQNALNRENRKKRRHIDGIKYLAQEIAKSDDGQAYYREACRAFTTSFAQTSATVAELSKLNVSDSRFKSYETKVRQLDKKYGPILEKHQKLASASQAAFAQIVSTLPADATEAEKNKRYWQYANSPAYFARDAFEREHMSQKALPALLDYIIVSSYFKIIQNDEIIKSSRDHVFSLDEPIKLNLARISALRAFRAQISFRETHPQAAAQIDKELKNHSEYLQLYKEWNELLSQCVSDLFAGDANRSFLKYQAWQERVLAAYKDNPLSYSTEDLFKKTKDLDAYYTSELNGATP